MGYLPRPAKGEAVPPETHRVMVVEMQEVLQESLERQQRCGISFSGKGGIAITRFAPGDMLERYHTSASRCHSAFRTLLSGSSESHLYLHVGEEVD